MATFGREGHDTMEDKGLRAGQMFKGDVTAWAWADSKALRLILGRGETLASTLKEMVV